MENQAAAARIKPLSLVDMSCAFVILGFGVSLAVLVFLCELIYKRIKDHYVNIDDHVNEQEVGIPVRPSDLKEEASGTVSVVKVPLQNNTKRGHNSKLNVIAPIEIHLSADIKQNHTTKTPASAGITNQQRQAVIPAAAFNKRNSMITSSFDEITEIFLN